MKHSRGNGAKKWDKMGIVMGSILSNMYLLCIFNIVKAGLLMLQQMGKENISPFIIYTSVK